MIVLYASDLLFMVLKQKLVKQRHLSIERPHGTYTVYIICYYFLVEHVSCSQLQRITICCDNVSVVMSLVNTSNFTTKTSMRIIYNKIQETNTCVKSIHRFPVQHNIFGSWATITMSLFALSWKAESLLHVSELMLPGQPKQVMVQLPFMKVIVFRQVFV